MKIVALDIGDVWTGSALADSLGISCSPYKTVATKELYTFLTTLFAQEPITKCVIGNPTTLKGTDSEQTKKVHTVKAELEAYYPSIEWVLWDERFSSKQAAVHQRPQKKKKSYDKHHEHSIAAAFILQSYLDSKAFDSR